MRQLGLFVAACMLSKATVAKPFRDSDGYLELPDCEAARAWPVWTGTFRARHCLRTYEKHLAFRIT